MSTSKRRWLVCVGLFGGVALFFAAGGAHYLSPSEMAATRAELQTRYTAHPLLTLAVFAATYVLVAATSLPGATVMTLLGGALFGVWLGTLVVSLASTLGATLAFLATRALFRDAVQRRFPEQFVRVNAGVDKEGAMYLLALRLLPVFPFFLVNLLTGMTRMGTARFFWVSQLGMLPATALYVNAGTELAQVDSLGGILSPPLLISLAALALFPPVASHLLGRWRTLRAYRGFTRPKRYDYNLAVIGGGAAGLVATYVARALEAKVVLVERAEMGGDCLNTGCVPSKALIHSARLAADARQAFEGGIRAGGVQVDFPRVMRRVHAVIARIAPHDSKERYSELGADVLQGQARLVSPWELEVDTSEGPRRLTARAIILATGAEPIVPPLPGIEHVDYLTTGSLWQLDTQPETLAILGGGPVGCELAQAFQRLGTNVTLIERGTQLLPKEDAAVAELVTARLRAEGVAVLLRHELETVAAIVGKRGAELVCTSPEGSTRLTSQRLLIAVGRKPVTDGLGLEKLGIKLTAAGSPETDEYLRTNLPNVFACGDVTGSLQFTHYASHQAWYAAVNALVGGFKRFRVDDRVVPRVTFTDPEVATVGITETQAQRSGIEYELTEYPLEELDRAITDAATEGVVRVITAKGRDRILGASIVARQAGNLIMEYALAMKHRLGLRKILAVIHPYPTLAEANRSAASAWLKAHRPTRLLALVARYHTWRRG